MGPLRRQDPRPEHLPKNQLEPRAPPSPAEPPSVAAAQDLAQVQRIWPPVLDKLAEKAPALAATFDGARPVAFDDEGLAIGFAAGPTFQQTQGRVPGPPTGRWSRPSKPSPAKASRRATCCWRRTTSRAAAPPPDTPAPGSEAIDEDALMNRLMSEFDAKEVN